MKRYIKTVAINNKESIPIINKNYHEPAIITNTQYLELFDINELEDININLINLSSDIDDTLTSSNINHQKQLLMLYILHNINVLKKNHNFLLNVIFNYMNIYFYEKGNLSKIEFVNNVYKDVFMQIIKEQLSLFFTNDKNNIDIVFYNIIKETFKVLSK